MKRHCEEDRRKPARLPAGNLHVITAEKLQRCACLPARWARNKVFAFLLVLISLTSNATIHTVKQDGSGDHTTIQAGINTASTGDTVLVWPGTYYENIDYNSKSITVGSLYLTTQDENYIHSTIIDGNMNGSCVFIANCSEITILSGFTIQNGSGDLAVQSGGGINIQFSNEVNIDHNRILSNSARTGGGLFIRYSSVYIIANSICFNKAYWAGGGIFQGTDSELEFNSIDKNNIYMNYAALGSDYIKSYDVGPVDIIVDTFTVSSPDEHFVYSPDIWGNPQYDINIQIENYFLEQVNSNLYVDPSGNDSNTGLSFNDPLKTISFALQKIETSSNNPRTIFLQKGTYSYDSNGEFLPLNPRSFLSIVGKSSSTTIIDAQNVINHLYSNASITHLSIKKLSFVNGFGNNNNIPGCAGIEINNNTFFSLDSTSFFYCEGATGVYYNMNPIGVTLNNINVVQNIGGLSISSNVNEDLSIRISNSNIKNTLPASIPNFGLGSGITIVGTQTGTLNFNGLLINNLVEGNICHPDPFWGDGGGSAVHIINPARINIINCTFSENEMEEFDGGTIYTIDGPQVAFYNNIFYYNEPRNLYLDQSNDPNFPAVLNFIYNDIEEGEESIFNKNDYNIFNWLDGNIDEDPLWEGGEPFSYALQPGSPCIDAGVPMYEVGMDYPYIKEQNGKYVLYMLEGDTVTLPAYDLAGNPRISGGRIDMGAYEWQDTVTGSSKFEVQSLKLSVYPNPFTSNVFVSFSLKKEAEVRLEVINIKGQPLKTVADASFPAGNYKLVWNGQDEDGYAVKKGNYLMCLYINGTLVDCEKMIKTNQ
ncbi:MAG: T9SS type A sorting domain-containing protein [Bacteroidetes bacterium]|nr:T9SS type A sorting domain-containing protein [Bacteroidota bacterium]